MATINDKVVGFDDINQTGYLDCLFVHKDYKRQGIATALCNQLERFIQSNIMTDASITAKSFFE
ncbi:MAG: GNAT family N-acetyltransferase [Enterococcus lemanii]